MLKYATMFIIFGFIGWIIDSAYRSYKDKRYSAGTLIPFFSIIYPFGGLMLYLIFSEISLGAIYLIIIGWISLVLLELLGGSITIVFLKRRLWNYSKNRYNFLGHIDVFHSMCWLVLTILFYLVMKYTRI